MQPEPTDLGAPCGVCDGTGLFADYGFELDRTMQRPARPVILGWACGCERGYKFSQLPRLSQAEMKAAVERRRDPNKQVVVRPSNYVEEFDEWRVTPAAELNP